MKAIDLRRAFLLLAAVISVSIGSSCATTPATPKARDVLVLGGTGQLGAQIVRALLQQGEHVTVLARSNSDRTRLKDLSVDYLTGDLLSEADVGRAMRAKKFSVVINAVRVEDGDIHFYEKILRPIAVHAKATGVAQIIHHGAVGAGGNAAKFARLGWDRVPGMLDRLRDQGVGEDLLRTSGVPYTIIRNSRLYPDATPATGKAELTEDDTVLTPMTRADLARLTVQCLGNKTCFGKTYHVRDLSLAWPRVVSSPAAPSGK